MAKKKAMLDSARGSRGDRREDIVHGTRRLLLDKGYESITIAEIAAALGLAEGTIYLYFENKRALMIAVVLAWFTEIVDQTERQALRLSDLHVRLRYLIQSHLEMILAQPEMYLLFIREVRASSVYESSGGRALNRRYTDLLRPCVEGMATTSVLGFPIARDMVYGGIEHVAWSVIVHRDDGNAASMRELAGQLAQAYERALGSSKPELDETIEQRLSRLERIAGISDFRSSS